MIHDDISDQIKEEIPAIEEVKVLLGLMNWPQAMRWLERDYSARHVWGPHLSEDEVEDIREEIIDESRSIYEAAAEGLEPVTSFQDHEVVLEDLPEDDDIEHYLGRFKESDNFQDVFGRIPSQSWSIKLVPIESLVAYQPHVTTTAHQEIPTSDEGLLDVIRYCLPVDVKNYLMDTIRRSSPNSADVQFVSRSPNVNLVGPWISQIEDRPEGNVSVTFNIQTRPNFVQVAHFRDRYILKNGYHRCYQLLAAGEAHVPAVVREVDSYDDTGAKGSGWFQDGMILGPRPPLVVDYLTDVAVDLESKVQNKVVRVFSEKFDVER